MSKINVMALTRREQLIYEQMVANDKRQTTRNRAENPTAAAIGTEPIEAVEFSPTRADIAIAAKWLSRDITRLNDTGTLATALRVIAAGRAAPLRYLAVVRWLELP
jgi:hypothetical protein